jgi:hypothetical protein
MLAPIWGIGRGATLWQTERAVDRLWRGRSNVKRREFIRLRGGSLAARRAREFDWDPVCGSHQGQRHEYRANRPDTP